MGGAVAVPYYDHAAMIRADRPAIDAAVARVLDRGLPDWGPEVPAFEASLAAFCGAGHAVATISGTQALVVALRALGSGPGDEVVTVPNTDSSTPSAIRQVGARPVLVDILPGTRNLDPARLADALGPRTRAILSVDMHGHPADHDAIRAAAPRLPIVSDACISLGATDAGRSVGTLADVTCVSFGAGKLLGTVGTGGACLTSDADLARGLRMLAGYGQDRSTGTHADWRYESDALNVRLPELQAAILRARLPRLPGWLAIRRAQARQYTGALAGLPLDLPQARAGTDPAWRNYVIGSDDPVALAAALARRGIETKRLYAPPMYHEPGYADLGRARDFPEAERQAARLLCLPIGPHLSPDQVARAAQAVRDALGGDQPEEIST